MHDNNTRFTRRRFLATAATGVAVRSAAGDSGWQEYLAHARELHRATPVFIGYCNFSDEQFQPSGGKQCDLGKLTAAGARTFVASIGFGCYFATGPGQYVLAGPDDWLRERQLQRVSDVVKTIQKCKQTRHIAMAGQLEPSAASEPIGVIVHLTGNNHQTSLDVVDEFFRRGVRATHPAMDYHARWCASQAGIPGPAMTGFGRKVIARMNDLGIAIDSGHASDESARAFIDASTKPISDSHTTSRDLVPKARGLKDETLKMLARSGGVIGVHFADCFLTADSWVKKYSRTPTKPRIWEYNRWVLEHTKDPDQRMKLRKDAKSQEAFYRDKKLPPDPPCPKPRAGTVQQVADLTDYLVRVAGIDHVGIGGDINGIDLDQWPEGMTHTGELPHLTAELLRRGWSDVNLRKFLSDNWRRVYARCLPTA